jgi:hypothetical protein
MKLIKKFEEWFTEHCFFLSAIPGFVFWSLLGEIFHIDFMQTFAAFVIAKISLNFLFVNLCRFNEYMLYFPERPFFALFRKLISSSFLNTGLDSYEDWLATQDFFSRSAVRALDHFLLFFILILCLFASGADYLWIKYWRL